MNDATESKNALNSKVGGIRMLLLALILTNIAGFATIAWMIDSQLTELRLNVGVLRAINDNRFAVDQRTYSSGQGRLYYELDQFKSVSDLVHDYESRMLSIHVSPGTYGKDWYLVDDNTNTPINFSIDNNKNPTIRDAGIKPGMVLAVVRKPNR
jgi:hypothetical protein